jgi:Uncharacterized protein conserved in bacteria (DUF2330)
MRNFVAAATLLATSLLAAVALPCGAGFGAGLEVDPSQKIVIAHDQGTETYVFSPNFCGQSAEFGLVLPIPAALSSNPTLASKLLFTELDELTTPRIAYRDVCRSDDASGGAGSGGGASGGVSVVDRGQVGIFDWVLLKADSTAAFTEWLDANSFPYATSATAHFSHYVSQQWHFVAFKVTVDETDPPAGRRLCGELGPISLTFPSTAPVIPARIATVDASAAPFIWDVFALSDGPVTTTSPGVSAELKYTSVMTSARLEGRPQLSMMAVTGDQLTKLRLTFGATLSNDITLQPSPGPRSYHETTYITREVDCDDGLFGCSQSSNEAISETVFYGLACSALALFMRRRSTPGCGRRKS